MREIPRHNRVKIRNDDAADAARLEQMPDVRQEPYGLVAVEMLEHVRGVHDRHRFIGKSKAAADVAVLDAVRPMADVDAEEAASETREPRPPRETRLP